MADLEQQLAAAAAKVSDLPDSPPAPGPAAIPQAPPALASSATDVGGLAAALEPHLIDACEGRLSPIQWFKSPWQAGGASTGYATFTDSQGWPHEVVVKLPVGPIEFAWTAALSRLAPHPGPPGPTLRVFAAGDALNGYDLAWLVVEKVPGHTLAHDLPHCPKEDGERHIADLLKTAAHWYNLSLQVKPPGTPRKADNWEALLGKARDVCRSAPHDGNLPEAQRWNQAVKDTQKLLPLLAKRWESRPINSWCHGDLHPGNVMRREDATPTCPPCVLLDLALVHPGYWVEDAVYLERLHWGRPELLHGVKIVSTLSKARRELGLTPAPGEDHTLLANIRRVLMAASVPVFLHREGHPKYVHHALEVLERTLPLVSK